MPGTNNDKNDDKFYSIHDAEARIDWLAWELGVVYSY